MKKDWLYLLEGRQKAPFAPINRNVVRVPGMPGGYLITSDRDVMIINQPVGFVIKNDMDALSLKDELASWLYTSEPVELTFDDEPGRTYYAVVQNTLEDFAKFAELRDGTIQFLLVDPHGYGTERTYPLSSVSRIPNEGTTDSYPVFDLTVTKDSSLITIANNDNLTPQGEGRVVYLGETVSADETPVERKTLILHDTMQSTSSWQGASDVDSGYVTGSFVTDHEGFYVETWGDEDEEKPPGANVWIGPSLQKALSEPLESFIVDVKLLNDNKWYRDGRPVPPEAVGIIEIYLRDINGNLVCKFQLGDSYTNFNRNSGIFATNGARFTEENGDAWNNFDGMIRIMRDSTDYYPYLAMIDDNGNHVKSRHFPIIQPTVVGTGAGTNQVTNIQVAMRKPLGARRMLQRIKEIKVYSTIGVYENPDFTVPIEFKAGDRLHIDVAKNLVLLNGEPRKDLFGLETDFFSLIEGLNTLEISDNIEGTVTFIDRYL